MLVRWKNKYDYAVKIHELSRIRDLLPPLMRWAERIERHEAYVLCGCLALKIDDANKAREFFERAESDGSLDAVFSLAYLGAKQGHWEDAAKRFIRAMLLQEDGIVVDREGFIALGRCLARLENRMLDGLASIYRKAGPPEVQRTAALLIAFALENAHPEAVEAALAGDMERARALAPEADVFKGFKEPLSLPKLPRSNAVFTSSPGKRMSCGTVTDIQFRGQSTWFGFLTEEGKRAIYYFPMTSVKDEELFALLKQGITGQRVQFVTSERRLSPYGKYLAAEEVTGVERITGGARTEDKNTLVVARSKVRLPLLPKSASLYAQAKRAEQRGNLIYAEFLYRNQITQGGEYRLSAIKDLAMLLNRMKRGEEAIQLLDEHRHLFDNRRPVDNLRTHLFVKTGRYDEAIQVINELLSGAGSTPVNRGEE